MSGRCLLPSQCKLNACVPHRCQSPMTPSNLLRSLVRHGTAILPRGQVRVWERGGRFQVPPHSPAALAEKLGCSSSKRFGLGVKGGLPPLEGCATRLPWLAGRRNRFGLITGRRKWRTRCWYSQTCLLIWVRVKLEKKNIYSAAFETTRQWLGCCKAPAKVKLC